MGSSCYCRSLLECWEPLLGAQLCPELGKGHAPGVCVHLCIITPELVLAGPS